ncbi:hypothetical protein FACS189427_09140 [Planctomycetales bacterium]|nr:hypothetical protein FACS189427_09140 [Planctomycetales bacterium]
MTILDRYILKSFFVNLVLWFFCIIGIYIVFDLFTNLEPLLEAGKAAGNTGKTIFIYYLFKTIPIGMMLCSLLGLISAMITIAMMIRHNELIPIQAAGVPTLRIIAPLVGAVILLALTAAVLREAVLPNYLDELVMNIGQLSKDKGTVVNAPIDDSSRTEWNFKDGKTYWTSLMGIHNYRNDNGVLAFDTVSGDPAITTQLQKVKADEWSKLTVRLKISPATSAQDVCQLFWSTSTSPVSETNSLKIPVKIDGQFHDYSFDLKNSKHWRRNITGFRLDPLNSSSKKVEIEFIRLEK